MIQTFKRRILRQSRFVDFVLERSSRGRQMVERDQLVIRSRATTSLSKVVAELKDLAFAYLSAGLGFPRAVSKRPKQTVPRH